MDISERNNGSDANDEKLEVADGEAGDGEQGRSGGKKPKMAQTPRCQVEKCKEALSKDYYRRHRVCELHSKARKVLLLGFEQRFCQQCSRKWRSGAKSGDYRIKGRSNEDRSWQKKHRSVSNDKPHLRGELLF